VNTPGVSGDVPSWEGSVSSRVPEHIRAGITNALSRRSRGSASSASWSISKRGLRRAHNDLGCCGIHWAGSKNALKYERRCARMVESSGSAPRIAGVLGAIVDVKQDDPGRGATATASFVRTTHPCQLCLPPRPHSTLDVVAGFSRLKIPSNLQSLCHHIAPVDLWTIPSARKCSRTEGMES
jgi:hypothetical protein